MKSIIASNTSRNQRFVGGVSFIRTKRMHDEDADLEENAGFDVHNDAKNLASGAGVLSFLCLSLVTIISLTVIGVWMNIIVSCIAFPVLIVSKSKPAKKIALGALLGIVVAVVSFWIPRWVKY